MKINKVIDAMTDYYSNDWKRINHFTKVYSFAKIISDCENIDEKDKELVEVSAVVYDMGINIREEKYNCSDGKYQEIEVPIIANTILSKIGFDSEFIKKVCWLVEHHHTYSNIIGTPHQILIEADFLVNIGEESIKKDKIEIIKNKIFKTMTGLEYLSWLYNV